MRRKINRENIIKTGLKLIHLNGYTATGIKEITDAVDIPKGSFYNHFESKEQFGIEVLRYYENLVVEHLEKVLGDTTHPPLERMRRFFRQSIENFETTLEYRYGCLAGNFGAELGDVNPLISEATFKTLEAFKTRFAICLNEMIADGDLPDETDTGELAEFITNGWQGAMLKMKASRNAYPLQVFYRYTFEVLLPRMST